MISVATEPAGAGVAETPREVRAGVGLPRQRKGPRSSRGPLDISSRPAAKQGPDVREAPSTEQRRNAYDAAWKDWQALDEAERDTARAMRRLLAQLPEERHGPVCAAALGLGPDFYAGVPMAATQCGRLSEFEIVLRRDVAAPSDEPHEAVENAPFAPAAADGLSNDEFERGFAAALRFFAQAVLPGASPGCRVRPLALGARTAAFLTLFGAGGDALPPADCSSLGAWAGTSRQAAHKAMSAVRAVIAACAPALCAARARLEPEPAAGRATP